MVKYNYFEELERLSVLSLSAVTVACGRWEGPSPATGISELRLECDRLVCRTEDALFSDFLPPLERDGIAAVAHCLSRVIDRSSELLSDPCSTAAFMRDYPEAQICVRLAEELRDAIFMLKRIRKPQELPDLRGYRELLSQGRAAHKNMLSSVRSGAVSKRHRETIILTARLRTELSEAFDKLVEVMLNNI